MADVSSATGPRAAGSYERAYLKYAQGLPSSSCSLENVYRKFLRRDTATKRYAYVHGLMQRRGLLPERVTQEPGGPSGAELAAGERLLAAESYTEAFHVFTCCMVESPLGTEAHARALAGRSRALYRMGRYEECAADVRRALGASWGPPDGLQCDLLCRGGSAMNRLGRGPQMTAFFERALRTVDAMVAAGSVSPVTERRVRDKLGRVISRRGAANGPRARRPRLHEEPHAMLGARHERYPALSEHLEFRRTPDMGLGVFTKRDLEPGDVIAIEKAHIGLPHAENYYICNYADCQKFNTTVIFCQRCTSVYYCSNKCLDKDNRNGGHLFECQFLRAVRQLPGNKKINQLALKWFIRESTKMGLDEYCSTVTLLSKSKVDPLTRKNIKNGQYDNFVSAYSMEIRDSSASTKRLLFFNCIVVEMLQFLLLSGYKIPDHQLPTIGASLVHMLQVLDTNSQNFIAITSSRKYINQNEPILPTLDFSMYPSIGQLNHSCDPNVMIRQLTNKRTLVLRASRPIPKNNQLLISYGKTFVNDNKAVRNAYLQNNFNFECGCQACNEDWPILQHLPHIISTTQIINPEMVLDILQAECRKFERIRNTLVDAENIKEHISANKKYLFSFLKFLHTNVKRPHYLFEDCHDIIHKDNDSYFVDIECHQILQLIAMVKTHRED